MSTSAQAVAAAVSVARDHGIAVTDPVILKDSYNLRVHLCPARVVARIPTVVSLGRPRPAEAMAREVAVVSYLDGLGFPVVPPSDLLPPGPIVRDGVAITFWRHVGHDPQHRLTSADMGRALAELHAALRGFPGDLPALAPAVEETAHLLGTLATVLNPDELAELRAARDALTLTGPLQPVHGDAHPGNLLMTADGPLWNDFEETHAAPVAWDLAVLLGTSRLDGRKAVLAYGADPDELGPFVAARRFQVVLWMLAKATRFPEDMPRARAALGKWRAHRPG
ncbi:aminoglycoside phosphotransferase family protein [Nonomuraea typhae]|uniref:Aminoglycoside phosphotransferase family protein n=1 Tax=Nonomuraea typhae TaxID=2603600 RepID=A0ABW7ZE79_9ACTN